MQDEQPAAVGEERLDLDPADERRDALGHVGGREHRVPGRLGFGVGEAVAGGLADLVGDQGDGLGLVEQQPALAALARQFGGQEQKQAILLAGEEAHRGRQSLTRQPHE